MHKLFTGLFTICSGLALAAPALSDFRISGGQLYNILQSVKWFHIRGIAVRTIEAGTILQESHRVTEYGSWYGAVPGLPGTAKREIIGYRTVVEPKKFVLNYKSFDQQECHLLAIKVGVTNYNGETMELFDAGFPNTHENRKLLSVTATNATPAHPMAPPRATH